MTNGRRNKRAYRRWAPAGVLLALLLALLSGPGSARAAPPAQPAGLTMTLSAGYDGQYKLGEWFPVQVTLSNTGQPLEAEVHVDAIGSYNDQVVATYARPVSLPSPSRKQVTLYTFAASFQHKVHVQLLHDHTVLLDQTTTVTPLSEAFLLGVVSDSPGLLNELSNTSLGASSSAKTATVAHLAPDALPASAPALGGLDALVFANTDTSKLSAETRRAIGGWVVNGGTLVVAGGQATSAGLADLLPVAFGGSQAATSLDPLLQYVGRPSRLDPSGALVSDARLLPGIGATAVISQGDRPLLARRPLGAGEVLALALDPSQPPLKNWDQNPAFWQHILADHTVQLSAAAQRRMGNATQGGVYYGSSSYYLQQLSPFDLPVLQLPDVWVIGVFLLFYVLVVGPLNYWVLRRRRRTDLAWLTIPVLILLFVGFAYVLGYQSKGGQLRLTTSSVIHTYPGAPLATVESFVGLFSPSRTSYNLQFADDVQLAEVNSVGLGGSNPNGFQATIYEGKPSGIPELNVDTWSLRSFEAEGTAAFAAPYTAQLRLTGNQLSGTVTNQGSTTLQDVAVIFSGGVQRLGDLHQGQSVAVNLRIGSSSGLEDLLTALVPGLQVQSYPLANGAEDRARQRRAALLASAFANSVPTAAAGAQITGWTTQGPLAVQVAGQNPVRDDLLLITGAFPVEQPTGQITLPPGLIARQIVSGDATVNSKGADSFLTINGPTTFEYHLPTGVQVTRLTLDYAPEDFNSGSVAGSTGNGQSLGLQVFNWRLSKWDTIGDAKGQPLTVQDSYRGDLAAPADYISDDGIVRLQVLADFTYVDTLYVKRLDLSGEGQRGP